MEIMSNFKENPRTVVFSTRVTPEDAETLEEMADNLGLRLSRMIHNIIMAEVYKYVKDGVLEKERLLVDNN